jgi:hypothetical protein
MTSIPLRRGTSAAGIRATGPGYSSAAAQLGGDRLYEIREDEESEEDDEEDTDVRERERDIRGHAAAAAHAARLLQHVDQIQHELRAVDESLPEAEEG